MERKYAEYLLKKTQEDYNSVAEDYTRTRVFVPEDIKELAEYALVGERILDSGCANGRLFGVLSEKKVDYFGIDFSEKLIEIAEKNYLHPPQVFAKQKFGRARAKFQIADALNLPFPGNFFDKVYSISVLPNIPSREFQLQYLKEAKRVLKPEGLLILRVWDFWRRKAFPKLFLKYTFLKLIGRHLSASQLDFFDVFLPWKDSKGNIIIERYFHCFRKKELENLAKEVGFKIKKIWRAGKDPRTNIYLIAQKPL